ncbi:MAG TPA: hypothetical protein VHX88_21530 [Solirubrobacteraceae bacterium]|nr:hypothetical protein [Solirubrobacteraceae bacterium]
MPSWMACSSFTDESRRVLAHAGEEARAPGHSELAGAHLLLGL